MAHRTAPLTNMLRKGAKVAWTKEAELGVKECLHLLTTPPILGYPDFGKEFRVTSDASAYAVGAVLSQDHDGQDRPVAYISRRLTPAEERYSAIERELLGVVWAIEAFRPYVYGRRFKVRTDHKPLQWVRGLKESSARVSRWKEKLMAYDFEVQHMPGKHNVVADWLSRAMEACAMEEDVGPNTSLQQYFSEWNPGEEDGEEEGASEVDRSREVGEEMAEVDEVVNGKSRQIRWKSKTSGLERMDFRREGRRKILEIETTAAVSRTAIIRILKGSLRSGKTHYLYVGNDTIWQKLAALYREGEIGEGSTLVRCTRLVTTLMDPDRQREVAQEYHVGKTNHRGVSEMIAALKRRYFWDGMGKTVEDVVKRCDVCCRTKAATRPPVEIQEVTPTATRPLQRLEVDTFIWKGTSWITIIDTFSKLLMAEKVEGRLVDAVMAALRRWWRYYGTPEAVTSDGGKEYCNAEVRKEAKRLEIKWHVTTPGHMQGRGCVERVHGTISDHLRLLLAEQELDVETAMDRAVVAYNHSVHSATGYSPVELVFGGAFGRRDWEQMAPTGEIAEQIQAHVQQLRTGWRTARERLLEEKARRVLRHNVRTRDVTGRLDIGTTVYRKIPTNRRKELTRYAGPYKVVAILDHNRYTLESLESPGRRRQAHIAQLKIPVPASEVR